MKSVFMMWSFSLQLVFGMENQLPNQKKTGFADVNGTRLYYETAGKGQPVVLIHGFSLDTRMWDAQFEELSQTHQVIRYDLRGFGKSTLPVEGELYAHEEDLGALLAHLRIENPIVVGLSLGGRIAINYAIQSQNVKALVLADAVLDGYKWQDYSMTAVYEAAKTEGVQAGIQQWLAHATFAQTQKNTAAFRRVTEIVSGYSGWHFLHKNPLKPIQSSAIEHLSEIKVPTLVIVGEKEIADFLSISEILGQRIPNANKEVIKGVGHMSNMEDAATFNRRLQSFLHDIK
jgi:3-oxoadipate enol-lactonase